MKKQQITSIDDAFNSMLRSDYISLKDTKKLVKLSDYYVDYLGFLREVVGETDHLIVGRRGTGKTTLLYRGLIETINSWHEPENLAKPKTLGIYLDLSKCHSLDDTASREFSEFEHVFTTELLEAVKEEILRTWPKLKNKPGLLAKIFSRKNSEARNNTNHALDDLAQILSEGVLRSESKSGDTRTISSTEQVDFFEGGLSLYTKPTPEASAVIKGSTGESNHVSTEKSSRLEYRLNISDILRGLNSIREAAGISHIVIFIDEFSSLNLDLQRRFSTLLRKILGNHSGVFVKLSAITDNYTLGSSIILQRDLFELNLDLDSYVERSGTLGSAMKGLNNLTQRLITERVSAYAEDIICEDLFENFDYTVEEISKAAMGVPRTVGIILKQSFSRNFSERQDVIRKSDIDYGIRYASRAYLNQFEGSCGVAIPSYYKEIWDSLLEKAISERAKNESTSSHFMVLPKNEIKLKYFNMFFISHLLTQGRTTKKDKASRSLYCFDYGICIENNMLWGTEKNVIRQQRFAYDPILEPFDHYFKETKETHWRCPSCNTVYKEKELNVAGSLLSFCPNDKSDLIEINADDELSSYTEEEIKIVGAIRSSNEEDELLARHIADDVGCYVQKVAKFGEKLDREEIINRKLKGKYIYYKD